MILAFSLHKILLLVGSMVQCYPFEIPEQEPLHATSTLMGFFKSFTGLSKLMGRGSLEIMFVKKDHEPGKFRQLDEIIYIHGYPGYQSLSSTAEKTMQIVCDLKEVGSTKFFRLNDLKVLKWLCYKVHRLKQTLPTLDKNYAARDEKDTLFEAVSIVREYVKDEPWVNLLCSKLKLNLEVEIVPPSIESGAASFNPVQENNETEKKGTRTTRQAKKVKVEKDSHNIKDMFTRATRKRG